MERQHFPWEQKKLLNLIGLWSSSAKTEVGQRALNALGIAFTVFCLCYTSVDVYGAVVQYIGGNFENVIFNLTSAFRGVLSLTKMIVFLVHHKELASILVDLEDLMDEAFANVPIYAASVEQRLHKNYKKVVFFMYYITILMGLWVLRPIVFLIFTGERTNIFPTWSPLPTESTGNFILLFVIQTVQLFGSGLAFSSPDAMLGTFCDLILGQLDVLKFELSGFGSKTEKGLTGDANVDINVCLRHHQKILRVCSKLDYITRPILLAECITATILICSTIFETNYLNTTPLTKINNVATAGLMVAEVFAVCYFCQEISEQCSEVSVGAYLNNWYEASELDKKKLSVLMTMANREMKLGGIVQADLQTFINIMKSAFSYYSFLQVVGGYESN